MLEVEAIIDIVHQKKRTEGYTTLESLGSILQSDKGLVQKFVF